MQYSNTKVGSVTGHKFEQYLYGDNSFNTFQDNFNCQPFLYLVEAYVDNFMSLIIPMTREQKIHVAAAVMTGIHHVFPEAINKINDSILLKKMKQGESHLATQKTLLGFNFDGEAKTIWLENKNTTSSL